MWTTEYKGFFIQGYSHRNDCFVTGWQFPKTFKSYRAAQIAITKHIKDQQK